MLTVNNPLGGDRHAGLAVTLGGLGLESVRGDEEHLARITDVVVGKSDAEFLRQAGTALGVSERFRDVIRTFQVPDGETPAGFRIETRLLADGLLEADLVRDISYDRNGVRRPTGVVFSADTANPYEVAPIAPLLGNLTCNPGIVYDLFINNPEANVGGKFHTLEEVMVELASILGPGCDVSVEIEDPFEPDFDVILETLAPFEEILSPYRLVVKVPHTGPVNRGNVNQLLSGNKKLDTSYTKPATGDAFRSHNLALQLREHGYRVNYTLMFEPYQTALALQAKPAFINSFIRHRLYQTGEIAHSLECYRTTGGKEHLKKLRDFLVQADYLPEAESDVDLDEVVELGEELVSQRHYHDAEGSDGLDSVRHNLRMLRQCGLPDTRLIVCSMEGSKNYPDLDYLVSSPEFSDIIDRLVITAEPNYLARFTSTNQVISYQRRFMAAAATAHRTDG